MNIIKILTGCVLILIASVLLLSLFFGLIKAIPKCITAFQDSAAYGVSYIIGTLIGMTLIGILTFFIGRLGFKLVRSKSK